MNCSRDPCPELLIFTTVSKLYPKSILVEFVPLRFTIVTDCASVVVVVKVDKFALVVFSPASIRFGELPPTSFNKANVPSVLKV